MYMVCALSSKPLMTPATMRNRPHCVTEGFIPPMRKASLVWHGLARFPEKDDCLSSAVMALVMNGLHCQRKKGPGSSRRINTYARMDLLRMLKTLIQPPPPPTPPRSLPPLSPASLMDKPLGAGRRGTKVVEGGLKCVYVRVRVILHEVCQQISRGAGMSANSRSKSHTEAPRHISDTHAHAIPKIHPLLMP